jgi:condensin complex subunit 3
LTDVAQQKTKSEQNNGGDEQYEETITERLVIYLIKRLLPGMNAKDKNVRFHVCQLLAILIGFVGEMDEDLFELFLRGVMDRVRDKDATIRVQAVLALSKLQVSNVIKSNRLVFNLNMRSIEWRR